MVLAEGVHPQFDRPPSSPIDSRDSVLVWHERTGLQGMHVMPRHLFEERQQYGYRQALSFEERTYRRENDLPISDELNKRADEDLAGFPQWLVSERTKREAKRIEGLRELNRELAASGGVLFEIPE